MGELPSKECLDATPAPAVAKAAGAGREAWLVRFGKDVAGWVRHNRDVFMGDSPLGQTRRVLIGLLLLGGVCLLYVLTFAAYDRALVLTGRTEVLSMQLDNPAFGTLSFGSAVLRLDQDKPLSARGRIELEIDAGTKIRFARIGHDALRITFTAGPSAPGSEGCTTGLRRAGAATVSGDTVPLCEGATLVVPMSIGDDPLVVGLSGDLLVGEEVSQGAGARPILLEATASLLVKHGGRLFARACKVDALEHLCDRFVANSLVLSPGNSVRAFSHAGSHDGNALGPATVQEGGQGPHSLGFIRADPSEMQGGMVFNMAAPANAFEVTRMEGETFSIKESLFDVIEKSPLVRSLNVGMAAAGLLWYFLRLGRREGEEKAGGVAVLAFLLLALPGPVTAQQAMLRADENGQALLRARGDRCYAVTPAHVMGRETSAVVTAPGRERGEGDLLRRIPAAPEPVALLTLSGIPPSLCPAFEGAQYLDGVLRNRASASLRLVRADGGIDRYPLLIASVDVETFEVQTIAGFTLLQGMSGGTVLVADQEAGLLVDVFEEGSKGRVARLDRIFERLTPHLASGGAVSRPINIPSSGYVGYEVVRSSAAPVAPANRFVNLQNEGGAPWRVSGIGRAELTLKLAAPVSGIALDVTGLDDPPHTVELLVGRSETGPWQSLLGLSIEPGDTVQVRRFPATHLPYMMMRASASASKPTLAVQQLRLFAQ